MDKKKGSAMILAILLLSFFMALSLNMWFISQKKSQRAGDKIIGNRVLTDIDSSSTLGYYEFYLATEYVVNGFVTSPAGYTLPIGTTDYTTAGGFTTTNEGISLENEREYFGAYLSSSGSLTSGANGILKKDVITGGKLSSREWDKSNVTTSGAAVEELWFDMTKTSIGGYGIGSVNVNTIPATTLTAVTNSTEFNNAVSTVGRYEVKTVYNKNLFLNSGNVAKNKGINYTIVVNRTTEYETTSGGFQINSDQIDDITVEMQ